MRRFMRVLMKKRSACHLGEPIWKREVCSRQLGLYEKVVRGFYAASYSLLTDVGVYPVINGSAFYLDDFPSPVPEGDGTYVKRDYGMSISDFYMDVWWPDMQELASDHNVR